MDLCKPMLGTAYGNRIDLDEPLGLDNGQRIVVEVKLSNDDSANERGLRRLAGSLADLPNTVDNDLREILAARKDSSFREIEP
jgi:hypothetical protein